MKEEKTLHEKYGYYEHVLKRIGTFPLAYNLTIEKLKLSRGIIQAAYKEMYGLRFKGTIIDYLCYVSTLYLIEVAKKSSDKSIKTAQTIINDYSLHKKDTINLFRLFHVNPSIVLDNIVSVDEYQEKNSKFLSEEYFVDRYKIFMLFSSAWYVLNNYYENLGTLNKIYTGEESYELEALNLINKLIDG